MGWFDDFFHDLDDSRSRETTNDDNMWNLEREDFERVSDEVKQESSELASIMASWGSLLRKSASSRQNIQYSQIRDNNVSSPVDINAGTLSGGPYQHWLENYQNRLLTPDMETFMEECRLQRQRMVKIMGPLEMPLPDSKPVFSDISRLWMTTHYTKQEEHASCSSVKYLHSGFWWFPIHVPIHVPSALFVIYEATHYDDEKHRRFFFSGDDPKNFSPFSHPRFDDNVHSGDDPYTISGSISGRVIYSDLSQYRFSKNDDSGRPPEQRGFRN